MNKTKIDANEKVTYNENQIETINRKIPKLFSIYRINKYFFQRQNEKKYYKKLY